MKPRRKPWARLPSRRTRTAPGLVGPLAHGELDFTGSNLGVPGNDRTSCRRSSEVSCVVVLWRGEGWCVVCETCEWWERLEPVRVVLVVVYAVVSVCGARWSTQDARRGGGCRSPSDTGRLRCAARWLLVAVEVVPWCCVVSNEESYFEGCGLRASEGAFGSVQYTVPVTKVRPGQVR
ncbi:hypothetical protein HDK64DRAFT_265918 [Phyllosticta capitalensis]